MAGSITVNQEETVPIVKIDVTVKRSRELVIRPVNYIVVVFYHEGISGTYIGIGSVIALFYYSFIIKAFTPGTSLEEYYGLVCTITKAF